MDSEIYFEIIDGSDILKVEPLEWANPNSDNDWDKNWIRSRVTVKGGAFSGKFLCSLYSWDFELFKRSLKKAYDNLEETATFATMEEQIQINCFGDGLGHFKVDCKTMDQAGTGNELRFKMSFDQTTIPNLVIQLDNITRAFSVRGTGFN